MSSKSPSLPANTAESTTSNSPSADKVAHKGPLRIGKLWKPSNEIDERVYFDDVCFVDDLSAWKNEYVDPADSPAKHTRILNFLQGAQLTDEDVDWIKQFTNVDRLGIFYHDYIRPRQLVPFTPFRDLGRSTITSLTVRSRCLSQQEVLNFICSFPKLDYLHVAFFGCPKDDDEITSGSLRLPVLNGTFIFDAFQAAPFVRHLSKMPNGPRFQKIFQRGDLGHREDGDSNGIEDLVKACSETLKGIYIYRRASAMPLPI